MTEHIHPPETPWEYEEQERGQRYRIFIPVPSASGMTVARNIVSEERAQLIASAPRLKEERDEAVAIARDLFWLSGQMRHAGGVSTTRHDAILRKAGKTLERIDRENR